MRDASPSSRSRYHELLRAQAPYQRLVQAMALSRMVRELTIAGIKRRSPEATESEVRARLAVRLYGRAAAQRVVGAPRSTRYNVGAGRLDRCGDQKP